MPVDRRLSLTLLITVFHIATALQTVTDGNTYITEMIVPFDMPMDDLKNALLNQLSHNDFKTNSFSTDHVDVSQLVYKATYNGANRTLDPPYLHPHPADSHPNIRCVVTP
jgi:hypothetical protein